MRFVNFFVVGFTALFISSAHASQCNDVNAASMKLPLSTSMELIEGRDKVFLEHIGAVDDRFGTSLAMNTPYSPILSLRDQISSQLGLEKPLNFFTGWAPQGEAHVTVVTPVEYHDKLRPFVTPEKMSEIALQYRIQNSDLEILGIGRGQATLSGQMQDTYFVIVRSENLLAIRQAIYEEYLRNGGPATGWNPYEFYPHITVGYTGTRDLHIDDGVKKDVEHSLDERFLLCIEK